MVDRDTQAVLGVGEPLAQSGRKRGAADEQQAVDVVRAEVALGECVAAVIDRSGVKGIGDPVELAPAQGVFELCGFPP